MKRVAEVAQQAAVRAAVAGFRENLSDIAEQIVRIQQIPAPTFDEGRRAAYMAEQFAAAGLQAVERDKAGNTYGVFRGTAGAERPPLVISAHLDTVFPADTDLSVRSDGPLLYGPGIGDNSTGLAGLLVLARALTANRLETVADVWFVANVGEEGLGDLCGMRAAVERFGGRAVYLVVEGGLYGQLTHEAVGVRRYCVEVTGPGGHSWGGFGAPSAIHVLGRLITAIDNLAVPAVPKTTYNVGLIEGGLSINSIARSARMWLDLRSEDPEALERLVARARAIIEGGNGRSNGDNGVQVTMTEVGNRPAGAIDRRAPVVAQAEAALRQVGCDDVRYIVSSTDANVPLSKGYQAVCLGLTQSGNSHRPDEFIDITHLPAGMAQLLLLTLAMGG